MSNRLPPGQYETEKWPVLHYGTVPRFDPARWDFKVFGEVEQPVRLTYQEFMALPKTTLTCDIHCVTAWSKFGGAFGSGMGITPRPIPGRKNATPTPGRIDLSARESMTLTDFNSMWYGVL